MTFNIVPQANVCDSLIAEASGINKSQFIKSIYLYLRPLRSLRWCQ